MDVAEYPRGAPADHRPQLAVRDRGRRGDRYASSVQADLDRPLAAEAAAYLVFDCRIAEADAVPFGHDPSLIGVSQ